MRKLLLPIQGDFVAPRFDLATEIIVVRFEDGMMAGEPRNFIMDSPSDEELCQMVVELNITDVVCGGIEELHYNFLIWKKVNVIDGIIADWQTALDMAIVDGLQPRTLLKPQDGNLSL
ncbi:MAG: hypothetical protein CSA26_00465 [Desulfobacterales bacterium]|nr:MAG: hypothetical protein CSA26_00465 [Desulfobacterales bacterium]